MAIELVRGLYNLRDLQHGCAATIGSFDGVHRGHMAVLDQLSTRAGELQLPATLVTFEPQPREYFQPRAAPPRLTRLREKIEVLRDSGVQRVVVLPFNQRLARLSAEQFIQRVLVEGIGVKCLIVGDDFRFGRDRAGDFSMLQQAGVRHGFQVTSTPSFNVDGQRVSSTRIREALKRGELATAEALLGRPYGMRGRIAHGDKRGRTLGFPTANIHLHRCASPVEGVFAVNMHGLDAAPLAGVANVGTRPTVDGTRTQLEVHLFDFDREVYGAHVHVCFMKKLRAEQRFDSLDALTRQIGQDTAQARDYFGL